MSSALAPLRKGPSGPKAPTSGDAPRLFSFFVPGGPVVPPSSIGGFIIETDSFAFDEIGEMAWWATLPQESGPQAIVSVSAGLPTFPGATCSIGIDAENLDPVNAVATGPFRLVVAIYAKSATPGNIIAPP